MTETELYVRRRLFEKGESAYRDFHSGLMPDMSKERVIGVRVPFQRILAKEIWLGGKGQEYIKIIPHFYYEEMNIHAFCVEQIKDFKTALAETDRLLPFIDNWATCDMFSPGVFSKHPEEMYRKSIEWISSEHTYAKRYGIGMLMRYFLDENFSTSVTDTVADIRSDEYYVNMMIAWFFATALAKQYDTAINYLLDERLDAWTHNKTIRKAIESNRIPSDIKNCLRQMKR